MWPLVHRQYDYLAKLGVQVHDRRRWNVVVGSHERGFYYASSHARFHTTQDRVWLDGVDDKKRWILRGWALPVAVASAPEFGNCDVWVCNGHHTLAAYLDLGRTPYLRYFDRVAFGYAVLVPTFNPRATR